MTKKTADGVAADMREAERVRKDRENLSALAKLREKLLHTESRLKQCESDLEAANGVNDFLDGLRKPVPVHIEQRPHKVHGQATGILNLSDWHVEERVDPSTVNNFNSYSPAIASKRIKTIFEKCCVLLDAERQMSKISDMVVFLGGDFITGYIHPELEENNYMSPTEACLFVEDHICGGLDYLLQHAGVKSITLPCVTGNHGRTTLKLRISTSYKNSYEWLMYKHLERYYKNDPRVRFKVENGYHNWLDVQGHPIRFHHGHAFRYQGGVQGPGVPIRRKIAAWNKQKTAWRDIFGHLHIYEEGDNYIINPSLIGYGAYGEFAVGGECLPMQTLVIVDRKRSIPVSVKPIFCD